MIYVLYHANCYDGFGAAYAAWKRLGDAAVYIPMKYDDPLPVFERVDTVIMLDYSRKADDIFYLVALVGVNLIILDHHKTAISELNLAATRCHEVNAPFEMTLDMDRSGAMLAWQYFHPEKSVPLGIALIQDRDLWRWEFGDRSRQYHAGLCSIPFDFAQWDEAILGVGAVEKTCARGRIIQEYHDVLIEQYRREAFPVQIGDWVVPCVSLSLLYSEVPNVLCTDQPFAAWCRIQADGKVAIGLRSDDDGFDVEAVAKVYGGGGHPKAAGFTVSVKEWAQMAALQSTRHFP